ncbi:GGDEF domain-containing protein [Aureimonas sp. AU40]|uniref:GGDEF domain-containing protein n=1 Tax=Aureimonas sp. AU40 TaxID=1637747 RepID=UPI000785E3D4|nr:GGDEF domain-containing protein [Aureimonas sp. AU40]
MQIDLSTLYVLVLGTLGVSASLTYWERRFQPHRQTVLARWALGHVAFATGCALSVFPLIESPHQRAPIFLLMVCGYGTMLAGVLMLNNQSVPRLWWAGALLFAALCFALFPHITLEQWHMFAGASIALISGATGLVLRRGAAFLSLRSRRPAALVFLFHAAFYVARVAVFLVFDLTSGPVILASLAKLTMFEAVLFAVAAPMLLLSLVREEGEAHLFTASQTDYLTGLPNRRALFERAERRLREADETGEAVSVLVFDLDHFKSINDTHGHQIGDEVLKLFARTAERELRSIDLIARFGGEEFVAVVAGRSLEEVRGDAQRVARSFSAEAAGFGRLGLHATVSVGLAHTTGRDADLSRLLSQADAALYRAKTLGRDRIEQAPPLAAVA